MKRWVVYRLVDERKTVGAFSRDQVTTLYAYKAVSETGTDLIGWGPLGLAWRFAALESAIAFALQVEAFSARVEELEE